MDIREILSTLTIEEKAALVAGTDFMYTNPIPRVGVPSLRMADGPHGLRVQSGKSDNGVTQSHPATAFPTAATVASGWNAENARRMGEAIAAECKHYGVHILLGPGVNIKRNPLAGRNFEYFSEDPLLAGEMAAAQIEGVQSKGVGVSVKHFALNNAENYRFMGDSIADMRAIREIYLKVFERVVKAAKPYSIMCAYNKINGEYCSENAWLLEEVLRKEWKFEGAVLSDWGAVRERVDSLKAGLDLEMPGDTPICRRRILDGLLSGMLTEAELDKAVLNILKLIEKCTKQTEKELVDWDKHHELSAEIAEDCAVLLKNEGALPLKNDKKYYIVGELFEKMRYQGAGSSMINPARLTTPKAAFDRRKIAYEYRKGYAENEMQADGELLEEALAAAKDYETVLAFVGLTDYVESEGCDRANMRLPENQLALIDGLIQQGKKPVIILFGGSTMELPFEEAAAAILDMFLPGQNGGEATARLLFGESSPRGRLAETWLKSYDDLPFGNEFSNTVNEVYKESIFVGYRYFTTANVPVLYPFGYGLSYTEFAYSGIQVCDEGEKIRVCCEIENVGSYDGAEVVQLYVRSPKTQIFKPKKELRAFQKVYLKIGERAKAVMEFEKNELCYYDIRAKRWVLETGRYELELCSHCNAVRLQCGINIEGEQLESPYAPEVAQVYDALDTDRITDGLFEQMSGVKIPSPPPIKPIGLESKFSDLKTSAVGKILFWSVTGLARGQMKKAKRMPEGAQRDNQVKGAMFLMRIFETNSLRAMSMSAGGRFPYNFAEGFAHLANGRFLKGAKCFCTKIKVPKLPKDEKKHKR